MHIYIYALKCAFLDEAVRYLFFCVDKYAMKIVASETVTEQVTLTTLFILFDNVDIYCMIFL